MIPFSCLNDYYLIVKCPLGLKVSRCSETTILWPRSATPFIVDNNDEDVTAAVKAQAMATVTVDGRMSVRKA
eukprot:scaffold4786_cov198-Amphora_coffeaeformis.AAC.16